MNFGWLESELFSQRIGGDFPRLQERLNNEEALKPIRDAIDYYYGVTKGVYNGASNSLEATGQFISDPSGTIRAAAVGLSNALVNYPETFAVIKGAVSKSYNTMLYGTPEEKGGSSVEWPLN